MTSQFRKADDLHFGKGRLLGFVTALGLFALVVAIGILSSSSNSNESARATNEAAKVLRTNTWLSRRGLDANSSVDMMKALILGCDEIRARGDRC